MIWSLIVGGILGWLCLIGRDVPGGVIILSGIIGFLDWWKLLGSFGPVIGGYAIIPALIGAIILIFIVSCEQCEMNKDCLHL